MKNIFLMLVGIPGSGKSTYINKLIEENKNEGTYQVFSSDAYRKSLYGDESIQGDPSVVFNRLYADMKQALNKDINTIIFDATNINRKDRKSALDILKKYPKYECFALVMNVPMEICVYRDSKRERTVGEHIIKKMISKFQYPQKEEGFTDVILVNESNSDSWSGLLETLHMAVNYDQKNYHHRYTLDVHQMKLAELYKLNSDEYIAALFHDIGKLCTQSIDKDGIAHYYNHANYSAYWVMAHPVISEKHKFNDIMFYINEHMYIRDIVNNKTALQKYKNLFGDEKVDKLIEFMKNDNIACGT